MRKSIRNGLRVWPGILVLATCVAGPTAASAAAPVASAAASGQGSPAVKLRCLAVDGLTGEKMRVKVRYRQNTGDGSAEFKFRGFGPGALVVVRHGADRGNPAAIFHADSKGRAEVAIEGNYSWATLGREIYVDSGSNLSCNLS